MVHGGEVSDWEQAARDLFQALSLLVWDGIGCNLCATMVEDNDGGDPVCTRAGPDDPEGCPGNEARNVLVQYMHLVTDGEHDGGIALRDFDGEDGEPGTPLVEVLTGRKLKGGNPVQVEYVLKDADGREVGMGVVPLLDASGNQMDAADMADLFPKIPEVDCPGPSIGGAVAESGKP